jgi:hypothetical protein
VGAGIQSSKKTYATHKQTTRHAEVEEVKEAQIRRAARWSSDAMSGVFLTSLPGKFMRRLAGFREEVGSFSSPEQVRQDAEEAGSGDHHVGVGVMALSSFVFWFWFRFSMYTYIYLGF